MAYGVETDTKVAEQPAAYETIVRLAGRTAFEALAAEEMTVEAYGSQGGPPPPSRPMTRLGDGQVVPDRD